MNTFQLWNALTTNPITRKKFGGIYSIDTLKVICTPLPTLILCNTDISTQEGKHWILFYLDGDTLEFFDSLGNDIDHYGIELLEFLKKTKARKYKRIPSRIQPVNSSSCGEYCLYYAYARCRGESMKSILLTCPTMQTLHLFINDIYIIPINYEDFNKKYTQKCLCF